MQGIVGMIGRLKLKVQ
jgi:hypothetical protein